MSVFDLKIWKKLTGARSVTAIDSMLSTVAGTSDMGPRDNVTLTNPGTTYASVLDVTGRGYLLTLKITKPTTVNSVAVQAKVTLDGTVVATDLNVTATDTATSDGMVVGQIQQTDSVAPNALPPVFLPFNKSLKVEAKYSGSPGGNEDITAIVFAVYN